MNKALVGVAGVSLALNLLLTSGLFWMVWHSPRVGDPVVGEVSAASECQHARFWSNTYADQPYRAKQVEQSVRRNLSYSFNRDTAPVLRQQAEVTFDQTVADNRADIEYWCNR